MATLATTYLPKPTSGHPDSALGPLSPIVTATFTTAWVNVRAPCQKYSTQRSSGRLRHRKRTRHHLIFTVKATTHAALDGLILTELKGTLGRAYLSELCFWGHAYTAHRHTAVMRERHHFPLDASSPSPPIASMMFSPPGESLACPVLYAPRVHTVPIYTTSGPYLRVGAGRGLQVASCTSDGLEAYHFRRRGSASPGRPSHV